MRLMTVPQRIATAAEYTDGRLRIRIQRELKNANTGNRHPHWSVRDRERKAWEQWILTALVDGLGYGPTIVLVGVESGLPGAYGGLACRCETKRCRCPETLKRRLTITRCVPSGRNFIRDLENRLWCCKTAKDAVTNLGLLRDDSEKWCTLAVDQEVSADGLFWTEFLIEAMS